MLNSSRCWAAVPRWTISSRCTAVPPPMSACVGISRTPRPACRRSRRPACSTRACSGSQRGLAAATGIAPVGRGNADWLQRLADGFSDPDGWSAHPGIRMVAFDYRRGERVVFGAPGAPKASAGEALRASWAVPGWMPPVTIGGRQFVDGGAASTASVDLIASDEAEIIYVITPMASEPGTRAPGLGGRLEHRPLRRPMLGRTGPRSGRGAGAGNAGRRHPSRHRRSRGPRSTFHAARPTTVGIRGIDAHSTCHGPTCARRR